MDFKKLTGVIAVYTLICDATEPSYTMHFFHICMEFALRSTFPAPLVRRAVCDFACNNGRE